MTEDEAKTKWCPFARIAQEHIIGPTYNRIYRSGRPRGDDMQLPNSAACIASACMAWRFADYFNAEGRLTRRVPEDLAYAGENWGPTNREGYCGLAGQP